MAEKPTCQLCGQPMPPGEEMFNYHGYSGPCPEPPTPATPAATTSPAPAPTPWRIAEVEVAGDGRRTCIRDAKNNLVLIHDNLLPFTQDLERIVACVNACHGLPMFNGVISVVADMKAAILNADGELAKNVRDYLGKYLAHDEKPDAI